MRLLYKTTQFYEIVLLLSSVTLSLFMWAGLIKDLYFALSIHFFLYFFLVVWDFIYVKRFDLLHVWVSSFIFIILSEMFILTDEGVSAYEYVGAMSYLILANDVLLIGYVVNSRHRQRAKNSIYVVSKPNLFLVSLFLMIFVYVVSNIYIIEVALLSGVRGSEDADSVGNFSAFSTIVDGIGLILPAMIAYYFKYVSKKSIWWAMVLALPVLLMHALLGTRFRLLFATLPFLMIVGAVNFGKSNLRRSIVTVIFIMILALLSSMIRDLRGGGILDAISNGYSIKESSNNKPLLVNLSEKMSNEGVVYMIKLSDDYFETHSYHYGKESGFIFYFWIPRALWPNKPTQLDHWLIREYESVSDAQSSASGFAGELKADFGIFSLFFIFIMGYLLKKADTYLNEMYMKKHNSFEIVIASAIVPYVFFFVRSPLTSSFSFFFEILLFCILRKLLCRKMIILPSKDY